MLKKSHYQTIVAIIVLVVVGWLILRQAPKKATAPAKTQNEDAGQNQQNPASNKQESGTGTADAWEGILKVSDNATKGNLMLVASATTIYIHTSRDSSALIGQQVRVNYKGSLDSFGLVDITAK